MSEQAGIVTTKRVLDMLAQKEATIDRLRGLLLRSLDFLTDIPDKSVGGDAEAARLCREIRAELTATTDQPQVPLTPTGHCAICGGTVGLTHRCVTVKSGEAQ